MVAFAEMERGAAFIASAIFWALVSRPERNQCQHEERTCALHTILHGASRQLTMKVLELHRPGVVEVVARTP
jgi:hypothetical protein